MRGPRTWRWLPLRAVTMIAVAALSIVVALWGLYIVAANVFLSTSLFERFVNADPETIDIHYRRGWSFFPGYVHAERLSIRASDSNVQWILRLDEVDFVVSLPALLQQRFDVKRARGTGVSFRIRQKMAAPMLTPDYVGELAPIPGFDRMPIPPPGPPSPDRWSDADYHLWTIHLRDVIADDVREIWVDRERFQGRARISGAFYLKPIRDVWVGPVVAEYFEGGITMSSRPVAADLVGHFKLRIGNFDPRVVDGEAILSRLSARTNLAFRIPDVDNIRALRESGAGLEGPADVERLFVRVVDGVVKDGSQARVTMADARLRRGEHLARASIDVHGDVAGARLAFGAMFRDPKFERSGDALARASAIDLRGDSAALALAHPLGDLHFVADARGIEAPDARAWNRELAGTPLTFAGGSARGEGTIETWLAEHRVRGHAVLDAKALDAKTAKAQIRGSFHAKASVGSLAWDTMQMRDAALSALVATGEVTIPDGSKLDVHGLHLDAQARELDGDDPLRSFEASAVIQRGGFTLASASGHFNGRGAIVVHDRVARGSASATSNLVALAIGPSRFSAAVTARARVHDWVLDEDRLVVDEASADLTDVVGRLDASERVPSLTISRARFSGSSPRLRFADPLANLDLSAKVEHGGLRSAAAIDRLLGRDDEKRLRIEASPASFDAEVEASIRDHVARGHVAARARGLGVAAEKIHACANIDVDADVEALDLQRRELALGSSRITITDVTGRLQPSGAPDFGVRSVELSSGRGKIDLAHPSAFDFDLRLRVVDAELRDARSLDTFLSADKKLSFESGFARGRADITFSPSNQSAHGQVAVHVSDLGVRLDKTRLGGSVDMVAEIGGFDPNTGTIDLSGSRIAVRDLGVTGASARTQGWAGDLLLTRGVVHLGDVPGFDGHVELAAKDASPLLAVALGDSLPRFLVGLVRAPHLVGRADLVVAPHVIAARNIYARGDDVSVRGDYVIRNDEPTGALVVSKGPLSAGVGIDHDGASLKLFGLDAWLGNEIRKATNLLRTPAEGKAKK